MRLGVLLAFLLLPGCVRSPEPLCAGCNVILVSIDTLRYDRPSFMGYHRKTTPRLDAYAAKGAVFENAFVHSGITMQSHMSMLTGLYPQKHGVLNYEETDASKQERLDPAVPTLAETLRAHGLKTIANFDQRVMLSTARGFARGFNRHRERQFRTEKDLGYVMERVERASVAQFFFFLHTNLVHDPYLLHEGEKREFLTGAYEGMIPSTMEELERIEKSCRSRQEECLKRNHARNGGRVTGNTELFGFKRSLFLSLVNNASQADRVRISDLYDSALHHADSLLGELFRRIEALKLPRRTLVIVTSDHGEELLEQGELGHGRLVEPVVRVPLAIFVLGGEPLPKPGARVQALAQTIDIVPTVLGLLGVPAPPSPQPLQGRSLPASPESARLKGELEAKLRAFEIYGEDPK